MLRLKLPIQHLKDAHLDLLQAGPGLQHLELVAEEVLLLLHLQVQHARLAAQHQQGADAGHGARAAVAVGRAGASQRGGGARGRRGGAAGGARGAEGGAEAAEGGAGGAGGEGEAVGAGVGHCGGVCGGSVDDYRGWRLEKMDELVPCGGWSSECEGVQQVQLSSV